MKKNQKFHSSLSKKIAQTTKNKIYGKNYNRNRAHLFNAHKEYNSNSKDVVKPG